MERTLTLDEAETAHAVAVYLAGKTSGATPDSFAVTLHRKHAKGGGIYSVAKIVQPPTLTSNVPEVGVLWRCRHCGYMRDDTFAKWACGKRRSDAIPFCEPQS